MSFPLLPLGVQAITPITNSPLTQQPRDNSLSRYSLQTQYCPRTRDQGILLNTFQNSLLALRGIPHSGLPVLSQTITIIPPPPIPTILPSNPHPSQPMMPPALKRSHADISNNSPEEKIPEQKAQKIPRKNLNALSQYESSNWRRWLDTGVHFFTESKYEEGIDAIRQAFLMHKEESFVAHLLSALSEMDKEEVLMHASTLLYRNPRDSYGLFLKGFCNIQPTKYADSLAALSLIRPQEQLISLLMENVKIFHRRETQVAPQNIAQNGSIAFLLDKA